MPFMIVQGPVVIPPPSVDPIPLSRQTDWTFTGVPGGIPNYTTVFQSFSPGATAASINTAISTCPAGQVVFLNSGTYSAASLGGPINILRSNMVLRGAGSLLTILTGGQIVNLGTSTNVELGTVITGGAIKGSNSFTVASTANLTVGTLIEVERDDDPILIPPGEPNIGNGTRNVTQMNMITGVSGSTITVRNPFYYDFSTGNPKVRFYFAAPVVVNSGIENMHLDHTGFPDGAYNSFIQNCDSCWIQGVESGFATGYHFIFLATLNFEVRRCYIHDGGSGPNNSGLNFFGNYLFGTNSNAKIEDCVFNKDFPSIEINGCSSGFYIGYNYNFGTPNQGGGSSGNLVTWVWDNDHAPFNIMNLYEGNISEMIGGDGFFGGSGLTTFCRNYATGYNPNFAVVGSPVVLKRLNYYYNLVGNVFGSTNEAPTAYNGSCGIANIYELGYPNIGNCALDSEKDGWYPPDSSNPWSTTSSTSNTIGTGSKTFTVAAGLSIQPNDIVNALSDINSMFGTVTSYSGTTLVINVTTVVNSGTFATWTISHVLAYPDAFVATTLLRWGNYDYFNATTRFVASEVPTSIGQYSVPMPSSQTLPKSYVYKSTPPWWPGGIPWPPIGPDVTGGNGDTAGHVNKIPAQVRWESGIYI